MEQSGGADARMLALEGGAPRKLCVFELLDAGEMAVDQGGIGESPKMLSGLQFRGIRRQEEQVDVVGDPQVHAGMPASTIEDEHDLLPGTRSDLLGKCRQFYLKERDTDRGRQMKQGAARGGMDKAHEIAPGEAMLHRGHWTLTNRRPDPPVQRL